MTRDAYSVSWAEIWEFSKSQRETDCCSNIAITISYISVFCIISIIPRLTDLWPFKCQGHSVSLWCWPLTCNLEKCYSLRSSIGMKNLERQLWYLHLLTRHCPCNLLAEPTSPKHEYRWKLWGHPVTSSMTSSPWKNFSWHNLGRSFHIWGQIAAVLNISKFSKWPSFWARDQLFLPEVIPEDEYTRKIAISISDILNFWLTL